VLRSSAPFLPASFRVNDAPLRIRPCDSDDLATVRVLAQVVWRAHYPGIIPERQIEYMLARMYDDDALRRFLDVPGAGLALASIGERPVGFAAWYRSHEPATAKLDKLYVLPEWHGRGVGRALIAYVEAAARADRCTMLVLNVNKRNAKAIAAYARAGFVTREAVVVDIGGGFVMDDYVMAKALAGA